MQFTFAGYVVHDDSVAFEMDDDSQRRVTLFVANAELAAVTTAAQLRDLIEAKLRRKVNREGIASKLDAFLGQSVTI